MAHKTVVKLLIFRIELTPRLSMCRPAEVRKEGVLQVNTRRVILDSLFIHTLGSSRWPVPDDPILDQSNSWNKRRARAQRARTSAWRHGAHIDRTSTVKTAHTSNRP
jgi:hypothetical protein